MSFGFSNIGHFFASLAQKIVTGARATENVLVKVQAAAPEIEAITGLIDPKAELIERAAFAMLGKVTQAVHDAGNVAASNGVNIPLDATEIADIKDLITYFKSHPFAVNMPPAPVTTSTVATPVPTKTGNN